MAATRAAPALQPVPEYFGDAFAKAGAENQPGLTEYADGSMRQAAAPSAPLERIDRVFSGSESVRALTQGYFSAISDV